MTRGRRPYQTLLWIGGMPRSGTTWIAQVFASHPDVRLKYDPLFSFEFKDSLNLQSAREDWEVMFGKLYGQRGDYLDQEFLRRDGLVPSFPERADQPSVLAVKSSRHHALVGHALEMGVDMRLLAVVRDPVDSVASWIGNPTEFPSDADPDTEWRSGACRRTGPGEYWGFDAWKEVTRLHRDLARRYPDRVRLVRYETLAAAPKETFAPLFAWAGLGRHQQTDAFLTESTTQHSDHPRAVYRRPDRRSHHRDRLPPGTEAAMIAETLDLGLGEFLATGQPQDAGHE